jgi:ribosomal protein L10
MELGIWDTSSTPLRRSSTKRSVSLAQIAVVRAVGLVSARVAGAQAIILAHNRGLPVAAMTQLRAKARASGVYFKVVKNTLLKRAADEAGMEACAWSGADTVSGGTGTS